MAAGVYSTTLWRAVELASGAVVGGPVVPAGYVWIVHQVTLWNNEGEIITPLQGGEVGFLFTDGFRWPFAATYGQLVIPYVLYPYQTRRVLEYGRQLYAYFYDEAWSIEVTGWQLSTP